MKTNMDHRSKYTLIKDITRSEHKSRQKSKAKRSSRKRRTLVETIEDRVFLANEKQGNFSKRNLLGSNHLLQQTKLNKLKTKNNSRSKKNA
jgi:hypothetical protein